MAYSKSKQLKDTFCHIAAYSGHVNFGFNRGAELTKETVKLDGKGKRIKHIFVNDFQCFPKYKIQPMICEAVEISEKMNNELTEKNSTEKCHNVDIGKRK